MHRDDQAPGEDAMTRLPLAASIVLGAYVCGGIVSAHYINRFADKICSDFVWRVGSTKAAERDPGGRWTFSLPTMIRGVFFSQCVQPGFEGYPTAILVTAPLLKMGV
jgi:hypothetical protein